MSRQFANNASARLDAPLTAESLSISLTNSTIPPREAGKDMLFTLIGVDENGAENAWEIVRGNDTPMVENGALVSIVVQRGQEGTAARAWPVGTLVEMRLTAGSVDDFQEAFDREQVAVDPALVALAEDTTKEGQTVIFGPDVRVDAVNVRDVVETGNLNNVSYVFSPTSSTEIVDNILGNVPALGAGTLRVTANVNQVGAQSGFAAEVSAIDLIVGGLGFRSQSTSLAPGGRVTLAFALNESLPAGRATLRVHYTMRGARDARSLIGVTWEHELKGPLHDPIEALVEERISASDGGRRPQWSLADSEIERTIGREKLDTIVQTSTSSRVSVPFAWYSGLTAAQRIGSVIEDSDREMSVPANATHVGVNSDDWSLDISHGLVHMGDLQRDGSGRVSAEGRRFDPVAIVDGLVFAEVAVGETWPRGVYDIVSRDTTVDKERLSAVEGAVGQVQESEDALDGRMREAETVTGLMTASDSSETVYTQENDEFTLLANPPNLGRDTTFKLNPLNALQAFTGVFTDLDNTAVDGPSTLFEFTDSAGAQQPLIRYTGGNVQVRRQHPAVPEGPLVPHAFTLVTSSGADTALLDYSPLTGNANQRAASETFDFTGYRASPGEDIPFPAFAGTDASIPVTFNWSDAINGTVRNSGVIQLPAGVNDVYRTVDVADGQVDFHFQRTGGAVRVQITERVNTAGGAVRVTGQVVQNTRTPAQPPAIEWQTVGTLGASDSGRMGFVFCQGGENNKCVAINVRGAWTEVDLNGTATYNGRAVEALSTGTNITWKSADWSVTRDANQLAIRKSNVSTRQVLDSIRAVWEAGGLYDRWWGLRKGRDVQHKELDITAQVSVRNSAGETVNLADQAGPQGRHREYAYRVQVHGAAAPATPAVSYTDGTLNLPDGINNGWTQNFPANIDQSANDYWEVFWEYDPATRDIVGEVSAPFKIDAETGGIGPRGIQGIPGPAGQGVASGGTAGQVLSKVDAADYNTTWIDAPSGGGGASGGLYRSPATATRVLDTIHFEHGLGRVPDNVTVYAVAKADSAGTMTVQINPTSSGSSNSQGDAIDLYTDATGTTRPLKWHAGDRFKLASISDASSALGSFEAVAVLVDETNVTIVTGGDVTATLGQALLPIPYGAWGRFDQFSGVQQRVELNRALVTQILSAGSYVFNWPFRVDLDAELFDIEVIATVGGGATGPAGRGISSITNHNNDNDLQINYSDSTSESVSVPSGSQGRGIVSITQPNRATDPTAAQVNFTDGLNPSNIVLPSAFGDQSVELVNISDRVTDPNNGAGTDALTITADEVRDYATVIAYSTYNNRKESATFVLGQSADMVLTHQNSAEANGVTLAAVAADGTQRLYGRAGEQVNEVYLVPKPQRSSRRWEEMHSQDIDLVNGIVSDVGYNIPADHADYEWRFEIHDDVHNAGENIISGGLRFIAETTARGELLTESAMAGCPIGHSAYNGNSSNYYQTGNSITVVTTLSGAGNGIETGIGFLYTRDANPSTLGPRRLGAYTQHGDLDGMPIKIFRRSY